MHFASALTIEDDPEAATRSLLIELREQMNDLTPDLALTFVSGFEPDACRRVVEGLRRSLQARVFLSCTAEGVIGAAQEIERRPAVSVIAAHLPGVALAPFEVRPTQWQAVLTDRAAFEHAFSLPLAAKAVLMLADPFSTPMEEVLAAFNALHPGLPIIGGMASGAQRPGGNVLTDNERVINAGLVGVALSGAVQVDVIVSQGCRPVGAPFTVTGARENLILSLENQPPVEQVRALFASLPPQDQALLQNGLFLGRAIVAGQAELGRGDFLIRGVLGVERETGGLAIGDVVQTGETVQFQVRDAETAKEDLEMMLLPQTFGEPPAGALLFSCNGRGTRLYDYPDGDISTVSSTLGRLPLAGFFCAGELGPIGEQNFLHGHTASLALFRPIEES
jgi:small ligand-binding sensory domain FIST